MFSSAHRTRFLIRAAIVVGHLASSGVSNIRVHDVSPISVEDRLFILHYSLERLQWLCRFEATMSKNLSYSRDVPTHDLHMSADRAGPS